MNEPLTYGRNNRLQRQAILQVLADFLPLITWKKYGANVMDVGCGPGDVTIEILLPLLPANFESLIGCDLSAEMVEHATKTFRNDRIDFLVLDIESEKTPPELLEKFDHVLSFFCLHWIQNHRQAFSNINYMLKTGGSIFLTFVADVLIWHIYEDMSRTDKWNKHMKDHDKYQGAFLQNKNREKEINNILELTGFEVKVCRIIDHIHTFKDVDDMRGTLKVIDPYVHIMKEELQDEYMDEFMDRVFNQMNCLNKSGELDLTLQLFVIVAGKQRNVR